MKAFATLLLAFTTITTFAQQGDDVGISLSHNELTATYSTAIPYKHFRIEGFVGVGNQDVNVKFDDLIGGIKIGFPLLQQHRWLLYNSAGAGFYIPNNPIYHASTIFGQLELGCSFSTGQSGRHKLFIEAGYRYGTQSYRQQYSNPDIKVAVTDTFRLSPLTYSIGYKYRISQH